MKKLKFVASTLALGLGMAWGSAHAGVTVDDFNSGFVEDPGIYAFAPSGTNLNNEQTGTMLGGKRTIDLTMLAGSGSSVAIVTVPFADETLTIDNDADAQSSVKVSWNFDATDFTAGGATGLFLGLPKPIDKIMTLQTLLSDGTNTSTSNKTFPNGSSGNDFFIPFTSFTPFTGGADFTKLTSMVITISSPNKGADTKIGFIETRSTPVPEPGTALLLSAALPGFWMRRKKQG